MVIEINCYFKKELDFYFCLRMIFLRIIGKMVWGKREIRGRRFSWRMFLRFDLEDGEEEKYLGGILEGKYKFSNLLEKRKRKRGK